jgi:hypothetical protein
VARGGSQSRQSYCNTFRHSWHSSAVLVCLFAPKVTKILAVTSYSRITPRLSCFRCRSCSANDDSDDCHKVASLVRAGLESTIINGGVDIVFGAHGKGLTALWLISDMAHTTTPYPLQLQSMLMSGTTPSALSLPGTRREPDHLPTSTLVGQFTS